MIANIVKELPVMLLEIKIESMNDDFITNIKHEIAAKNEKNTRLQKRRLNDSNDVPQTEEEPKDTIFDMFDLDPP